MEKFFLTKVTKPNVAHEYALVIYRIAKALNMNIRKGTDHEFTDLKNMLHEFDVINTYLDTLSLSTRHKYAIVLRTLVPFLKFDETEEKLLIDAFLKIAALTVTPYPRPRPRKGETYKLIPRKKPSLIDPTETQQMLRVATFDRLSRRPRDFLNNVIDKEVLTQINTVALILHDSYGNELNKNTPEQYKTHIFQVMRRFDPPQTNLNFLVQNIESVVKLLNDKNISDDTAKNLYTAIVKFLPIARPIDLQRVAYERYYHVMKDFAPPQGAVYNALHYKGYVRWSMLVARIKQIVDTNEGDINSRPLHRLLLFLYTDIPPRRSKDYTTMVINKGDDNENNLLIIREEGSIVTPMFIFNNYKTAKKSSKQRVPIQNEHLISELRRYLNAHPNNNVLLEETIRGERIELDSDDVTKIMRDKIGLKYKIPTGIRRLRHLYVTHVTRDEQVPPRKLRDIAYEMGTSVEVMINHYTDYREGDEEYDKRKEHGIATEEQKKIFMKAIASEDNQYYKTKEDIDDDNVNVRSTSPPRGPQSLKKLLLHQQEIDPDVRIPTKKQNKNGENNGKRGRPKTKQTEEQEEEELPSKKTKNKHGKKTKKIENDDTDNESDEEFEDDEEFEPIKKSNDKRGRPKKR